MWLNLKRVVTGDLTRELSATLAAAQCARAQFAYRFCAPQPDWRHAPPESRSQSDKSNRLALLWPPPVGNRGSRFFFTWVRLCTLWANGRRSNGRRRKGASSWFRPVLFVHTHSPRTAHVLKGFIRLWATKIYEMVQLWLKRPPKMLNLRQQLPCDVLFSWKIIKTNVQNKCI